MQKYSSSQNSIAMFVIVVCSLFISACATTVETQQKSYAWDTYQYHLSESQIESINQNLSGAPLKNTSNTPTAVLISKSNYWKFLSKIGGSSFFSDYQYSFSKCERESSGALMMAVAGQNQECKASYFAENIPLTITAVQLQNQTISLSLTSTESAISSVQKIDYDTNKDFVFIYQKLPQDNRLLIITPNQLEIPWSYYDKTPQSTAHQ